jgi:hypothetical protein
VTPLEAALLVVAIFLPFHLLVWRQIGLLGDPAHLREHGVVIVSAAALEAHSAPIGEYLGRPIWASVTFMGMAYRFDRVLDRRKRNGIAGRELFLEPGLVYVTE